MKKVILFSFLFVLPVSLFAQDKKDDPKKSYVEKCKKEFKARMTGANVSNDDIQQFCECNADKIFSKFTLEEIKKMDQILQTGSELEKKEVNDKITPVLMPCFTDIQSKMR